MGTTTAAKRPKKTKAKPRAGQNGNGSEFDPRHCAKLVAKNLETRMAKAGITGRELVLATGLPRMRVYRLLEGEHEPGLSSLHALARYFKCKVDDFVS